MYDALKGVDGTGASWDVSEAALYIMTTVAKDLSPWVTLDVFSSDLCDLVTFSTDSSNTLYSCSLVAHFNDFSFYWTMLCGALLLIWY